MLSSLFAVVFGLLSVSLALLATPAQSADFALCYKLAGLSSGTTLDGPYSIAVQLSGTYDPTVQTSVATRYTPGGQQYVQLLTITGGTRTINTRNGLTVSTNVLSLAPVNSVDFNNNRLYVSNISQWIDADGIAYVLDGTAEFPGKVYDSDVSIYRTSVYGSVFETQTSGIDRSINGVQWYVNGVSDWTNNGGAGFTSCDPDVVPVQSQFQPIDGQTVTVALTYHLQNSPTDPDGHFTIDFSGTFTSTVFGLDSFGDYYSVVSTATGSRVYCFQSQCVTSAVNAVGPINDFGFADNQVYGYQPYLTYNGLSYTLAAPVVKPGYALTATNTTSHVNIYVSKGGLFLEGFGAGGTGPNGGFTTASTTVSLTLS